ncbi:hypothetical protein DAEQUDRAFT_723167 [Daedalea quercina L-15889]|uniref:F-box domain-containing protein n=1 Tax=Daedalea quercina L-15889 TaxID=1314783 RepID=A0A165ST08_9APHY|nr:hypothetical protein DAEQUDRAFT_723167 [Daedalea quercina L-15889]
MPSKRSKLSKTTESASTGSNVAMKTAEAPLKWKNVRGRRGGLKDMMNMPMDVILEICLHLHPRELLSLCRTAKVFHAFLMQKGCKNLWRDSLKKVDGLPPCPQEMIEPAWVALVFSPYCTECGKGRAPGVYWEFLARFCATCRKRKLVSESVVDFLIKHWENQGDFSALLSKRAFIGVEVVTGFNKPCYLASQVHDVRTTLNRIYPRGTYAYQRSFNTEGRDRADLRRKLASQCRQWEQNEQNLRDAEIRNLLNKRLADIGSRLRKLDWGPEVDFLHENDFRPLAKFKPIWLAKPLTDRTWQNMQDELVKRMNDVQAQRLEHELQVRLIQRWPVFESAGKELLDRYFGKHPEMLAYGLNIGDLALQKEFCEIMCAPADVVVDKFRFLALEGQLIEILERWQERMCKQLRGLIVEAEVVSPKGINSLDLATTLFSDCNRPHEPRFFPDVVASGVARQMDDHPGNDTYTKFVSRQRHAACCYVDDAQLRFVQPTDLMREMIQMCGKDPDTVTAAEMDALDVRFVWRECAFMTWRRALEDASCEDQIRGWRLATAEETSKLKEREMQVMRNSTSCSLWSCTRCEVPLPPMTGPDVEEHLRTVHGIELSDIADSDIRLNKTLASFFLARESLL